MSYAEGLIAMLELAGLLLVFACGYGVGVMFQEEPERPTPYVAPRKTDR